MRPVKSMLVLAIAAGIAAIPAAAWAQSAKPETAAKSAAANRTTAKQAGSDDFEENRRLHMQKSKENNAKKGAE